MNAGYFSARTAKTKRLRREDIARLRDELAELLKSDRGLPETDAKLMAAWDPFDQNAAAPFFDPEWMFGLSSRFDLVIGNPPYVRQEAIKDQKPALEKHYGGKERGVPTGAEAGTLTDFTDAGFSGRSLSAVSSSRRSGTIATGKNPGDCAIAASAFFVNCRRHCGIKSC